MRPEIVRSSALQYLYPKEYYEKSLDLDDLQNKNVGQFQRCRYLELNPMFRKNKYVNTLFRE